MNRWTAYACTLALVAAVAIRPRTAVAALPSLSGESPEHWAPGQFSVVIATVKSLRRDPKVWGQFSATLVPLATLSGAFDPGLHPELPVDFDAQTSGATSIDVPPKARDTVIAVIHPVRKAGRDGWVVAIESCVFMPGYSAMVTVDGLGDPKVGETLKKIQAARAKGRAEKKTEDEAKAQDAPRPE